MKNFVPIICWLFFASFINSCGLLGDKVSPVSIEALKTSEPACIGSSSTLPLGYRPLGNEQLVYNIFDRLKNRRVDIMPNREVRSVNGGAALILFDGISFRAD